MDGVKYKRAPRTGARIDDCWCSGDVSLLAHLSASISFHFSFTANLTIANNGKYVK